MRVLVVTVVHHPEDARVLHREAAALAAAGHEVVLAAPFTAYGVAPRPWVTPLDLPRAAGRRRLRALRAARRLLRQHGPAADLVLLHDPDLLPAVAGLRLPPVVWDVHEDTAAALRNREWMPPALQGVAASAVAALEHSAERHMHLLLAEHGYARRLTAGHPVVPNESTVPDVVRPPGRDRVVYLGRLTRVRGAAELVAMARSLAPEVRVELVGAADASVRPMLREAERDGVLRWHGFVPNDEALGLLDGALAGLSLLHDEPNYRHSRPTKVVEYMARGIPVVTTPSPEAVAILRAHDCGLVVPFEDAPAAAATVRRLRDNPALRARLGAAGHAAARRHYHWPDRAGQFVAQLETWAGLPAPALPPAQPVRVPRQDTGVLARPAAS